jgi:hypothetical protein
MARTQRARTAAWRRSGSPIGRKGSRKANPKYKRRIGQSWSAADLAALRQLVRANTPTGVISLKIVRSETSIRSKARRSGISLRPANRSPYNRDARSRRGRARSR